MSEQNTQETLLEFPCDYAIKAMGLSSDELDLIVVNIVSKHVDNLAEDAVSTKESSGGKYTSISVKIRAISKEQLDDIYRELSGHHLIKYVL
jgi:hypothetical protein